MSEIRAFFTESQEQQIIEAIQRAELHTSGEIRVHIEAHHDKDAYPRAIDVFAALEMHKTADQNGVLFYLATEDHQFAILGDKGINAKVPANFWESIKDGMQTEFRKGNFTDGLVQGILKSGKALSEYFPYQDDDVNELPNEISTGLN
ncbi:MAG: TPM domain-containing protein [Schleiferiaceae bacterium]|jgi:uncharacterized membrane protein|nr:TPM domain-containing protein [Schleiferiaceae bacterium]